MLACLHLCQRARPRFPFNLRSSRQSIFRRVPGVPADAKLNLNFPRKIRITRNILTAGRRNKGSRRIAGRNDLYGRRKYPRASERPLNNLRGEKEVSTKTEDYSRLLHSRARVRATRRVTERHSRRRIISTLDAPPCYGNTDSPIQIRHIYILSFT